MSTEEKFDQVKFDEFCQEYRKGMLTSGKYETAADSCKALEGILSRVPYLAKEVAELEHFDPEVLCPVAQCPKCSTGKVHCVGRDKTLHSFAHSQAYRVVCDTCGYFEGRHPSYQY